MPENRRVLSLYTEENIGFPCLLQTALLFSRCSFEGSEYAVIQDTPGLGGWGAGGLGTLQYSLSEIKSSLDKEDPDSGVPVPKNEH